jgi:hypothetical protein
MNNIIQHPHDQKRRKIENSWSCSIRLGIIEHLITFDIPLMEVVKSYRFELELEEVVEIVRALDILGAERRLKQYCG